MIFVGLMAGTILLCWFINNTFLETYYLNDKQNKMLETYLFINTAANQDTLHTEDFDIAFQNLCGMNNIDIIIIDAEAQNVKTSTNDFEWLSKQLLNYLFQKKNTSDNRLIMNGENYEIRILQDGRTGQEYMDMWGVLDGGNLFLLRSPLESIRESVAIANRFLTYIGIGAIFFASILIMIISRKITEPIKELTKISERMNHLDFDAKYEGKSRTEIALLGNNINQLSETLEATISELKSANNELKKDIEKKNEIEKMRTEFLSNVSHELKTPIALIQGYAEGLREGVNDDEESRNDYCDVIADEAMKMNRMVQKLLTLNQLESGNQSVSLERFDITDLVRNYLQSSLLLCEQKQVQLRMEDYPSIPVWADEYSVEEVFNNYFTNALNHVDGEKIIEVRIMVMDDKVRVSVFNTGEPIPEDSIEHLWEKFYKVDKARTREYGGSGVGLSIVKAIMDSMNQCYGVQNYDNGVEFWFELDKGNQK